MPLFPSWASTSPSCSTAQSLDPARIVVVTGHGSAAVTNAALAFDEAVDAVLQDPQHGTAHAVARAAPLLADTAGDAIVLYADTPFIREETLRAMLDARQRTPSSSSASTQPTPGATAGSSPTAPSF